MSPESVVDVMGICANHDLAYQDAIRNCSHSKSLYVSAPM